MNKRNISLTLLSLMAVLCLSSCAKDRTEELATAGELVIDLKVGDGTDGFATKGSADFYGDDGGKAFTLAYTREPISSTVTSDTLKTKAEQINWATTDDSGYVSGEHTIATSSDNTFGLYGFQDGSVISMLNPDTFSLSDGKWKGSQKYCWPFNTTLSLSAFYPVSCDARTSFSSADSEVSFDYDVPSLSEDQKDLMFAFYQGKGTNGVAPLTFTHPLTAVKFKIGEVDATLGKITSITLKGVYDSGHCVATADATEQSYTYAWSGLSSTKSVTGTGEGSVTAEATLGDEFTFILIPQDLSEQSVKFTMQFASGKIMSATVMSGEWNAGFTNTYKIDAILATGLVISDIIEDNTKKNVEITNTGEAVIYVRAAIVGNWVDGEGNILSQWTQSQGTFTGLPGSNWITRAENGTTVYYYKNPLSPGISVPDDLFTSYEAPECTISGGHLEMEILVQGVQYDQEKEKVTSAWGSEIASQLNTL